MLTNADITIYNRKANPSTGRMEYCATVVMGVWWHTDQKVQILAADKGLSSADEYKIRIPMQGRDGYLLPEKYAALPYGDHTEYWTIENGDIFLKGIHKEKIEKPSDLSKKGFLIGTVASHSENFTGLCPHIRIGGI